MLRPDPRLAEGARGRRDPAGPVGQARGRVQVRTRTRRACCSPTRTWCRSGPTGPLQRARPQGPLHVWPDDGRQLDLHRQPGHRAGHLRDLFVEAGRQHYGNSLAGNGSSRRASAAWAARSPWRATLAGARLAQHRVPAVEHRLPSAHPLRRQAGARSSTHALELVDEARAHAAGCRSRCAAMPPRSCPRSFGAACVPTW
jgi:hypothetical protein